MEVDDEGRVIGANQQAPGERVEMQRYTGMLRFYGHTAAGRHVMIEMEQPVWEALGKPETWVLRVR